MKRRAEIDMPRHVIGRLAFRCPFGCGRYSCFSEVLRTRACPRCERDVTTALQEIAKRESTACPQ